MSKDDELALKIAEEMDLLRRMPGQASIAEYARRLRAAWMQEQEPVALVTLDEGPPHFDHYRRIFDLPAGEHQLYTAPHSTTALSEQEQECGETGVEECMRKTMELAQHQLDNYKRAAPPALAERVREAIAKECDLFASDNIGEDRKCFENFAAAVRNMDLQALIAAGQSEKSVQAPSGGQPQETDPAATQQDALYKAMLNDGIIAASAATIDRYPIPDFLRNQRNLANEQKALAAEKGLELASQAPNSFESRLWCPTYRLHLKRKCQDCTCGHIPSIAAAEGKRK